MIIFNVNLSAQSPRNYLVSVMKRSCTISSVRYMMVIVMDSSYSQTMHQMRTTKLSSLNHPSQEMKPPDGLQLGIGFTKWLCFLVQDLLQLVCTRCLERSLLQASIFYLLPRQMIYIYFFFKTIFPTSCTPLYKFQLVTSLNLVYL